MKYADPVVRGAHLTVRNPFAVLLASVGVSVAIVPFLVGIVIAGAIDAIVVLWTTSMFMWFVAVGGESHDERPDEHRDAHRRVAFDRNALVRDAVD